MDHGRRAITSDEVPLEWCLQPAVKLDFTAFDDGYVVTADDVQAALDRIDHELAPLEIVVINTRAGKRYGPEQYMTRGCGLGNEATMILLERAVRPTATDGCGWDGPVPKTATRFPATPDASNTVRGQHGGPDH